MGCGQSQSSNPASTPGSSKPSEQEKQPAPSTAKTPEPSAPEKGSLDTPMNKKKEDRPQDAVVKRKSKARTSIIEVKMGKRDSYEYMSLLGRGGFAAVIRVRSKINGLTYAMKIMETEELKKICQEDEEKMRAEQKKLGTYEAEKAKRDKNWMKERMKRSSFKEEKHMKALNYPFIISLHEHFATSGYIFLVMENVVGNTLEDLVNGNTSPSTLGGLDPSVVKTTAAQLVLTIQYMHDLHIVHRDLKPDNLMIAKSGILKLLDFGLSFQMDEEKTSSERLVGATGFKAPEMLKQSPYTYSVDWWNVGLIIYFMHFNKHPFHKTNILAKDDDQNALKMKKIPFHKHAPEAVVDIVNKLLIKDPKLRLGCDAEGNSHAEAIQAHPYFDGVDWEAILAHGKEVRFDSTGEKDGLYDPSEEPQWPNIKACQEFIEATDPKKLAGQIGM